MFVIQNRYVPCMDFVTLLLCEGKFEEKKTRGKPIGRGHRKASKYDEVKTQAEGRKT